MINVHVMRWTSPLRSSINRLSPSKTLHLTLRWLTTSGKICYCVNLSDLHEHMKLRLIFSIATLLGNLSYHLAFKPGSHLPGTYRVFPSPLYTSSSRLRMTEDSAVPATPESSQAPASKGFGKKVEKKVEEEVKDAGTLKYERDSKRGIPEYNIFMRPASGEKEDWVSYILTSLYSYKEVLFIRIPTTLSLSGQISHFPNYLL